VKLPLGGTHESEVLAAAIKISTRQLARASERKLAGERMAMHPFRFESSLPVSGADTEQLPCHGKFPLDAYTIY